VRSHFAQKPYLNLELPDMREFEKFLALCAGRIGQLLNLSELGSDAGISHTTARGWLSIIEQASAISAIEIKSSATFSF
jgi:predicted AAA+ superfamily ATPase